MPKNFAEDSSEDKNMNNSDDACGSELADLANLEKIAKAAAAAIQQQQELDSVLSSHHLHQQSNTSPNSSQSPHALTSSPKNSASSQAQLLGQLGVSSSPAGGAGDAGIHGVQMMHSRNSCKTLKCPKCNWHYKYQETLEIHMKEKHPENEMNCMYCLTNQAHPRLARGETYTCGYKPYRCEVCNYSTTTKGNLSIHMQSDKHINNVQELQNGSLSLGSMSGAGDLLMPPQAALLLKSGGGSSLPHSCSSNPGEGGRSSSNASSPGAIASSSSSALPPLPTASPKASSNTVPGGLIPPSPHHTPSPSPSHSQAGDRGNNSSSSSSAKPKPTWRCDVCNYETNVARNLRIHLTSEKHSHNMMVLQQNVKHMQQLTALQSAGLLSSSAGGGVGAAGGAGIDQMFHPSLFAALAAGASASGGGMNPDALQPEAALADMAYNHALLMMASQHQQQRAMAAVMHSQVNPARSPNNNSNNNSNNPFALPSQSQPTVDLEHPDPSLRLDAIPFDDTCHVFHCCICTTFTCDTLESLSQHIQKDRTRIREDEVLAVVGGSYVCKLCQYKTNLKANFQLHCKTDKHLQRLQQVNHIKEGEERTEWKIKYVNVSNPVQVRCNVCDYYTNSIHKLQLHASSPRHETATRVFLHLQLSETIVRSASGGGHDGKSGKVLYYNCAICQHASRSKIGLVHHMNTLKHLQHENMRQLKLQQQQTQMGSLLPNKTLDEEIRDMFQVKELTPGDNVNFADGEFIVFGVVLCVCVS
jgi:AT-binding transcription factor 1